MALNSGGWWCTQQPHCTDLCRTTSRRAPRAISGRACFLQLSLQKVVIQRQQPAPWFGWLVGKTRSLLVDIAPTGQEQYAGQRVQAREKLGANLPVATDVVKAEEVWAFGAVGVGYGDAAIAAAAAATANRQPLQNLAARARMNTATGGKAAMVQEGEMVFDVRTDTELSLRVLSGSRYFQEAELELLGLARFRPDEDLLPFIGLHGIVTLPLVENGRVCGSVSMMATVRCVGGTDLKPALVTQDYAEYDGREDDLRYLATSQGLSPDPGIAHMQQMVKNQKR